MTAAAAHMFGEMAEEFRLYLNQEGIKGYDIKAQITGIRKLRPHIEQIVKRNMQANITDVIKEGAEGTRSVVGTSFGLTNDEAVKFASEHTSALAGEIAENSVETVREVITDGIKNGRPVKETRKLLEERFADWGADRAEMVARTETLRAANMGSLEVLKKGGVDYKQFIAAPDACGTCLAIHEQVYRLKDTFLAKGDSLNTATETFKNGYMSMPAPPIHPRCRCTIGGVPGSMVDERSYMTVKSGKKSADGINEVMGMFGELDPAREFSHMRNGLRDTVITRTVENGTAEITIRRYGDRMSVFLKDMGTSVPTAENWAGEVGQLAYGDLHTWLPDAQGAGNVSIRLLAGDSGSLVSLSSKAVAEPTVFTFSDAASKAAWVDKFGSIAEAYPEPTKLLTLVKDEKFALKYSNNVAETYPTGSKEAIRFNSNFTRAKLDREYAKAYRDGYTTIRNADEAATHEFGHVVHTYLENQGIDYTNLRQPGEKVISDYATRNHNEYFAELFTKFHEQGFDESRKDMRELKFVLQAGGLIP